MGIDAVALLKGKEHALPATLKTKTLDDATLVYTGVAFGSEPEEMAEALRTVLGAALDAQNDPRGVFVMPDRAKPTGQSYQAVIDEVGELGIWVEHVDGGALQNIDMAALPAGLGGGAFGALVSELMQSLGPDTLADMQRALLEGDHEAMARAQAKMTAALGGEVAVAARSEELLKAAQQGAAAFGHELDVDALRKEADRQRDESGDDPEDDDD
jgi:hypothetical protein